ncbi:hypothetical protein F4680DRAFT_225899 [Xylaria scruposa]|nr:hypothetical protein F4680DRAFT_225899 [Xylaria scruposa]
MSITRSSESAEHPWDSIHQWQANAIEDSTENQFPLAAQRYDLIIRLYKLVLKLLCFENDHNINRRLKRAFETLILWGQQYGVSTGELDRLIDQSWRLRRSVLRTLTSIGRILTDRLTPRIQQPLPEQLQKTSSQLRKAREEAIFLLTDNVESEHVDERSDDDDSDTSSVFEIDSVSEIAEDLTSDVGNLMDLDALYDAAKENANFYEEEPVARTMADLASTPGSAARVYTEMIQMRFPEANYELLDYLGRANYYRFIRGSQKRENNDRQAEDNPETREHDAITVDESKFHDSGIGTSCYTGSYAETVMSFHHENGSVIRIPPLPEEGKKGLPFPCIACGNKVIVRSNKAWKRHLFSDLEPYNCLETSCRHIMSPFGRREIWVEHLAVHHGYGDQWQSFRCNLCLEETGQGEANVTIHLEKHLQDIALAALPNNVDEESKPESDSDSVLSNSTGPSENRPSENEAQNIPKDATSQAQHIPPNGHDYYDLYNSDSNARDPLDSTNSKISSKKREGCLTCRKRKKKCDESKPECFNCTRGGFVCYGYPNQQGPPRTENKPSSYWSLPEAADFPNLLRSYGSDWIAIAAHMKTKTAVMVKNYYARRKDSTDWETIVQEADSKKSREKQTSQSISSPHNTPHYSPPRAPKTSNLMALLNGDPPALPKGVAEVPAAPRSLYIPPPYPPQPSWSDGTPMRLQPPNSSSQPSSPQPQHAHGGPFNRAQGIEDFSKAEHEDGNRRAQIEEEPDSPLLFPLKSDPEYIDEYLPSLHDHTASVTGVMAPGIDRIMTEVYNDELYSPDFKI